MREISNVRAFFCEDENAQTDAGLPKLDRDSQKQLKSAMRDAKISPKQMKAGFNSALSDALDFQFIDLFARGWAAWRALRPYRLGQPGADEVAFVPLFSHTFSSSHKPKIDLVYQGTKLSEIPLSITLKLYVDGGTLKLFKGKIWEASGVSFSGSGVVKLRGATLYNKKLSKLKLPAKAVLKHGYDIPI